MADMVIKGRAAKPKGQKHPMSKLTPEIVMAIRQAYARGEATQGALATIYGLHRNHVNDLIRGKRWPHLPLVGR